MILFQSEALGMLESSKKNEVKSIETYAALKAKSEECKHPKEKSGAKAKGIGKIGLLLMLIMSCLLF